VLEIELCQAQYCVPKPLDLFPVEVLITYCTVLLLPAAVLPKKAAARVASAASCDCVGVAGAALALSYQTPARTPAGLVAAVPAPLQKVVPVATPWQYCVTLLFQELRRSAAARLAGAADVCSFAAPPSVDLLHRRMDANVDELFRAGWALLVGCLTASERE